MAWLSNTGISCLSPYLPLSITPTHTYLVENGVLPIPCHVSGFSFVKICSFAKWKDVFIMKYFTLNYTASLWLLYSLTILLLGVGCNKILKTKLRCGPSLCFSLLYTYICICKEAPLWQNWPQCQSKCKAVRASLEGQSAALCDDLDRKRAPVGCSIWLFPVLQALSEKKAVQILSNFWSGFFIIGLQSLVFTWL